MSEVGLDGSAAPPDSRHYALQRLVTRLLHDRTLLSRLYQDPDWARDELKLSREEYQWLTQIDQRRWEVDPERPHRSLEGALAQSPVTALAFSSWCRSAQRAGADWEAGVTELLSFYQSAAFHRCIERGERIAESLLTWALTQLEVRPFPATLSRARQITQSLITLERSVIAARHELQTASKNREGEIHPEATLTLPPHARLLETKQGVVDLYLALYTEAVAQSAHDQTSLLRGSLDLSGLSIGEGIEGALLERSQDGISVEALSDGLGRVLKLAQNRASVGTLYKLLIESGFEIDEARAQVAEWVAQNFLNIKP